MKFQPLGFLACLAVCLATFTAHAQRAGARGVTFSDFNGWPKALAMEARDAPVRAVVVPAIGGRVMEYGRAGQNILWVNPKAAGQTLADAGFEFQPGGFQCDLGPEKAMLPAHPTLWAGSYEWSAKKAYYLTLKAPEDKALEVELDKEIVLDPATGDLGFTHRIKNKAERETPYCLWHRIACRPGGFAMLPLNPRSRFPARWSMRNVSTGRIAYDGVTPSHPEVRLMGDVLVARTGGTGAKIGTDGLSQWIAYVSGRMMLVVHFPAYSTAVYSEGGNSATVAWDETSTELQPLSPETRLRSRKTYEFPMKWTLVDLSAEVTTHDEARALVEKIPGSPFQ